MIWMMQGDQILISYIYLLKMYFKMNVVTFVILMKQISNSNENVVNIFFFVGKTNELSLLASVDLIQIF